MALFICDLYYKLNEKYYGKDVVIDKEIQYEWMRIPHFYYNFYVYKYAIGLCCASRIVDNILILLMILKLKLKNFYLVLEKMELIIKNS